MILCRCSTCQGRERSCAIHDVSFSKEGRGALDEHPFLRWDQRVVLDGGGHACRPRVLTLTYAPPMAAVATSLSRSATVPV